jgi:hypothetical protein
MPFFATWNFWFSPVDTKENNQNNFSMVVSYDIKLWWYIFAVSYHVVSYLQVPQLLVSGARRMQHPLPDPASQELWDRLLDGFFGAYISLDLLMASFIRISGGGLLYNPNCDPEEVAAVATKHAGELCRKTFPEVEPPRVWPFFKIWISLLYIYLSVYFMKIEWYFMIG